MAPNRMLELKAEFQSAFQRLKVAKDLDERQAILDDARIIVAEFNQLVEMAQEQILRLKSRAS